MQVYHNNRCRKSREALQYLEEKGVSFDTILYLDSGLKKKEITDLLKKLDVSIEAIIRKEEAIFKENFKGKTLKKSDWIQALVDYPKLLQRPIIVNNDKAVIGRPKENIDNLL